MTIRWLIDTNSPRNLQKEIILYQNRNQEAIAQFQSILEKYKGQEIVTLLRLGRYEKTANYNLALSQYQEIDHHNDGIYR
jgi:hypothetical protein